MDITINSNTPTTITLTGAAEPYSGAYVLNFDGTMTTPGVWAVDGTVVFRLSAREAQTLVRAGQPDRYRIALESMVAAGGAVTLTTTGDTTPRAITIPATTPGGPGGSADLAVELAAFNNEMGA